MSDEDAYMALVLNNAQGELGELEIGMHALGSRLSVREYAALQGFKAGTIQTRIEAAKVAIKCSDIATADLISRWSHLAEIHVAAEWAWPALVEAMLRHLGMVVERKNFPTSGSFKLPAGGKFQMPLAAP